MYDTVTSFPTVAGLPVPSDSVSMYKPEDVFVIALRSISNEAAKSVSSITSGLNPSLHAASRRTPAAAKVRTVHLVEINRMSGRRDE